MKGNVLVFVLIVLTLVLVLGTGVIAKSLVSQQHSLKQVSDQQAYYIAKSVLDGVKEHFTNLGTANSAAALLPEGSTAVTSTVEIEDKQGRKWNCKVIIENNKVKESKLAADEVRITATAIAKDNAANSKETISMILKQKQEMGVGEGITANDIKIRRNSAVTVGHKTMYANQSINIGHPEPEYTNAGNGPINWGFNDGMLPDMIVGKVIKIDHATSPIRINKLYWGIDDESIEPQELYIEGTVAVNEAFYKDATLHKDKNSETYHIGSDIRTTYPQPQEGGVVPVQPLPKPVVECTGKETVKIANEKVWIDGIEITKSNENVEISNNSKQIKIKGKENVKIIEISNNNNLEITIEGNITAENIVIENNKNNVDINIEGNIRAKSIKIENNNEVNSNSKNSIAITGNITIENSLEIVKNNGQGNGNEERNTIILNGNIIAGKNIIVGDNNKPTVIIKGNMIAGGLIDLYNNADLTLISETGEVSGGDSNNIKFEFIKYE